MFLRKTHLAWKKCAIDERMSYKNMDCGIYVVVPGTFFIYIERKKIRSPRYQ